MSTNPVTIRTSAEDATTAAEEKKATGGCGCGGCGCGGGGGSTS